MNDAEGLLVAFLDAHAKDDVSAVEFGDLETQVFGGAAGAEAFAGFGEGGAAICGTELLHLNVTKSFLFSE
jgi:hypothetical protein